MNKILLSALAITAAAICCAQSTYGYATFIQRSQTYGVGTAKLYTEWDRGPWSINTDALLGANITDVKAAFGCDQNLRWDSTKGWGAGVGIGLAEPFSQLKNWSTLKTISLRQAGIVFYLSAPIDLSSFFGGSKSASINAQALAGHVISGPGAE